MIKYSSLGGMAQLVEHSLHMRGVTGSSPVVSTNNPIAGLFFLYNGLEWRLHRLCAMFAQPVTKVTLHAIDLR